MSETAQHHHVRLVCKDDAIEHTRDLLVECAERVATAPSGQGPSSWCVSNGEVETAFYIEALFPSQADADFHVSNIADIAARFGPLMAAPPATEIRPIIATARP